ncbi:hypothetical protein H6P81_010222 [Aristolochia fimbriata]|uniref:Uncharacterized protein n=1 Tax=Aristolochia fimbriata TaxID=158543 RepID=A0AAV7ERH7_ARIFI|nr:hypothetical protein H6P81_010222 [Aristolochia fimbriata]
MWVATAEGAVMVYWGASSGEGDERVERERSEEANDDSSSEGSWSEPVLRDEVEEEEDVELPLPTMGVPPLEENDEVVSRSVDRSDGHGCGI